MTPQTAHEGSTVSIWADTHHMPDATPLCGNTIADVCVVGGGIAGLTTAYQLANSGRQVVLIEAGELAGRQTRMTTAHLATAIDDRFVEIERMHGADGARLAAESHARAIDYIERVVRDEQISCEFERIDGYLIAGNARAQALLERELEAARRAGVDVDFAAQAPIESFETSRCLRFANQAQFHPLKYLSGLVEGISRRGGRLYGSTRAKKFEGGKNAKVTTENGTEIRAGAIVVATNTPINDMVAIHSKQAPYVTYVIGCRIPKGSVHAALYWDTLDPYHYVRIERGEAAQDHDVLIVGGEDHKAGQAHDGPERFHRLESWASARFPMIESVDYQWSGQVMETIDGLAFIGRNPLDADNVYIATGDSGMGMTHGTIAGLLISDLILGNENPWTSLYDPSRKTVGAAVDFAKENLNVAKEYTAWLTGGDVSSEDQIPPGCGAVIRYGTSKLAVYRDEDGMLTKLSAVCPHLKCIVSWNPAMRTWDCPCHGSRFEAHGQVLDGPAYGGLSPYNGQPAAKG